MLSVFCPTIFMAVERGPPARSRFRTAVRRCQPARVRRSQSQRCAGAATVRVVTEELVEQDRPEGRGADSPEGEAAEPQGEVSGPNGQGHGSGAQVPGARTP